MCYGGRFKVKVSDSASGQVTAAFLAGEAAAFSFTSNGVLCPQAETQSVLDRRE